MSFGGAINIGKQTTIIKNYNDNSDCSDDYRHNDSAQDVEFEEVEDLYDALRFGESANPKGNANVIHATDSSQQEQVIAKLKTLIKGKRGKDAFFVYEAFFYAGLILPATYVQFENTVGKGVVCRTDYYRFLSKKGDPKETVKEFAKVIKAMFNPQ